ncbi:exopolysaccharide biosynthesis polyprenyl glycosylphosphotransferase [Mesohalobacter halotolerans]|uniref:Exopolysaccharide biosynthesis polyprenyl glycosylphosphotransferase n=1 Tax=Mesohalobacter halotolerans TaxID=1883405 RepID=A0A4U5TSR6_9FLAO|nr:exopolysaccharide biosynthesis polyprenyl glycosylphosphotransferase [Mesohalobacter halotolerans]TKS57062.1 exopolysaccharide biosynthesis polyprenyl glycosylphosphotransferase [Mesohalobacter halotolerans]
MTRRWRYIGYLRPIIYTFDISVICLVAIRLLELDIIESVYFCIFHALAWVILSLKTNYYEVYRFTKISRILSLAFEQFFIFSLLVFFYLTIYKGFDLEVVEIFKLLILSYITILGFKLSVNFLLKRYRKFYNGNLRKTIIIGDNLRTHQLKSFFNQNPEFGYKFLKMFCTKGKDDYLEQSFKYVIENGVDEIYCSMAELTQEQINTVVNFADNNLRVLKFLPDTKDIYAKQLKVDYYGYLPILSLRQIPIEEPFNQFIKRSFDFIFSLLVVVIILSWLTPLVAILIKLESKGPVFFKQKRNGLNYREFVCFKFRSMRPNTEVETEWVKPSDDRVTKIGKFIRKTSIDELPQFYNVLLGDMSVVGPRPHPVSHTEMFVGKIDKFMVRHFVKPGITGLAQVSGYRGEIETDKDIINRVKYDIFYLENWSVFLDIKIVLMTIFNAFKGDKKAY